MLIAMTVAKQIGWNGYAVWIMLLTEDTKARHVSLAISAPHNYRATINFSAVCTVASNRLTSVRNCNITALTVVQAPHVPCDEVSPSEVCIRAEAVLLRVLCMPKSLQECSSYSSKNGSLESLFLSLAKATSRPRESVRIATATLQ